MEMLHELENLEINTVNNQFGPESSFININYKRVGEIGKMLKLHKDTVSYRIKELGIVATKKWWYNEYQIELIRDFERSPRTKYIIVESKINKDEKD